MRILAHIILFIGLTLVTQIGGLVYFISVVSIKKHVPRRRLKRIFLFITTYLLLTFFVVPRVAPLFGREKIKESSSLQAHSFFYKLANRNYVRAELNAVMQEIATAFETQNEGIKMSYLDANFPFIDGFPLLPHLSHNDGKKVDVSLVYEEPNGQLTNKKPSVSGYGVYENPLTNEYDQHSVCKEQGYWQYDFPKYLTFGRIHQEITLSEKGTRDLILLILKQNNTGKLFIEPHLKRRLGLNNSKVRFHGCQAVRHDDHIHFQLQ